MKRLHVLFVLVFCSWSLALALPLDSSKVFLPDAGAKALEFKVNGLLSISGHIGSGITYKKFTAPNKAIRYGISYSSTITDESGMYDTEFHLSSPDTTIFSSAENEEESSNSSNILLSLQLIRYSKPGRLVTFYSGFGPIAGMILSQGTGTSFSFSTSSGIQRKTQVESRKTTIYSGLTLSLGTEWFFKPSFSLNAEYLTQMRLGKIYNTYIAKAYNYTNDVVTSWYNISDKTDGIYEYIGSGVYLGLNVYFNR